MDVRIGVTHSPKEIGLEMPDGTDPDALKTTVDEVLAAGGTLWLTDRKGRQVGVPAEKVAYVEVGRPDDRRIGFGG
ncbi:MAG: DUF3107 domain-containing protein [Microthrixaceae bacterium]|nr:DUF3107 domain-containing protein [Acidimicrobiales bacterium]MCB9402945.1 DUF3107 domain-containing protein [Microthrixaceae bacterium]